jgi:hypothetical protein
MRPWLAIVAHRISVTTPPPLTGNNIEKAAQVLQAMSVFILPTLFQIEEIVLGERVSGSFCLPPRVHRMAVAFPDFVAQLRQHTADGASLIFENPHN